MGASENFIKPFDKLRLLKEMNLMVPSVLAIHYNQKYGLKINGQVQCTSMASSSGGIAIGEAFRWIKYGY
jgi:3-oxoacyl-(acyl-carrier-protein) synthase